MSIKILKNWEQIKFSERYFDNGTSISRSIPDDTLLDELIRIPQSSDVDRFGLQSYRNNFLPQEYDYKNQKLLRDWSDSLVEALLERYSVHENQCEVDKFMRSFCTRRNINYENYQYYWLLREYCMNILPYRGHNRKKVTEIEGLYQKLYGKCETLSDFMKVNNSVNPVVEVNGIKYLISPYQNLCMNTRKKNLTLILGASFILWRMNQ